MPNRFQGPSAVVIVDMWPELEGSEPLLVLAPLLKLIQQDFVKCIVIASYAESTIHGTQSTPIEYPIWHNSRQIFNPNLNPDVPHYTGAAWLAQEHAQEIPSWYHGPILNQFVLQDRPITNQAVLDVQLAYNQKMFAAWTLDQLVYLLNSQYSDIENIYLCGGAYELCLQDRPLGVTSLSTALRLEQFINVKNLLIPTECVYTKTGALLNANTELINPNWYYDRDQQLIHVQKRVVRKSTVSKDVLAALVFAQEQLSTVDDHQAQEQLSTVDTLQAALAWARLETKKRRGLL